MPGAVSCDSNQRNKSDQGRCGLASSIALPLAEWEGAIAQPLDPRKLSLISFPLAPELYRGQGSAVSLPRLTVGTPHCPVLAVGNIDSDANRFDITPFTC